MNRSDVVELIILVIVALIIALSFSVGWDLILSTDTPQVAVTTRSMTPTYYGFYDQPNRPIQVIGPISIPVHWLRGDLLIIQGVSSESLEIGDVIVFDEPHVEIPVVHRIVAINETEAGRYFLTKGDDNPISDSEEISWGNRFGWIHQSNVHGKVILRIPHVGWLSLQIQSPESRIGLVLFAALLLIISFSGDDEEKEDNEEEIITVKNSENSLDETFPAKEESINTIEQSDHSHIEKPLSDQPTGNSRIKSRFTVVFSHHYQPLKRVIMRRGLIPVWLLLLIIMIFSVSASLNYISGECDVIITTRDDEIPINDWSILTYSSSTLFEKWSSVSSYSNYSIYSYNIKLYITSRGFLNWISSLDIETNTTGNGQGDNLYRWTVVYDFHGTKVVNSCIKMYLPDNQSTTWIQVTVKAKTSGLLNQGILEWQWPIQVITSN